MFRCLLNLQDIGGFSDTKHLGRPVQSKAIQCNSSAIKSLMMAMMLNLSKELLIKIHFNTLYNEAFSIFRSRHVCHWGE